MVSASVSNTFFSNAETSAKTSVKEKKGNVSSDFNKLFENQNMKETSVNKDSIKNDFKSNEMQVNASKNDKMKEIIHKSFSEKETAKESDIADNTEITQEAIVSAMENIISEIVDLICDVLDVSKEEVVDAINDMGIKDLELLSNASVNELICKISGKENIMEILTDGMLSEGVKEINERITQFIDELETRFDMDFETIVKELPEKFIFEKDENGNVERNVENKAEVVKNESQLQEVKNQVESSEEKTADEKTLVGEVRDDTENNREFSSGSEKKDFEMNKDTSIIENNQKKEKTDVSREILSNVFENVKEVVSESLDVETDDISSKIIKQITDEIHLLSKENSTALEIQLEPERLGKVSLTVASKAGTVTAQLVVQNEISKEAIESRISELRESLDKQGIKVDAIEVTLASKEFEQNLDKGNNAGEQNEQKKQRHISKSDLDEVNGITGEKEESIVEDVMKQMGNTVSYTA